MSIDSSVFSGTISVVGTSNQIVLGTTNTTTLTATTPVASRVYTLIDAGTNAQVVLTEGNQTINGTKTWTGDISTSANFAMPLSGSSGAAGVITSGGIRFMHNTTSSGTNYNSFLGLNAGNFTLTGTGNCCVGAAAGAWTESDYGK